jgi:hypothetical protein
MSAGTILPVRTSMSMLFTAFRYKHPMGLAIAVFVAAVCGIAKEAKSGELETLAEAAQKELAQAKEQATAAATRARKASSEAVDAQHALRELEIKIEGSQPAHSQFGKARDAVKKADQAYHAAESGVLDAPAYRAAYAEAKEAGGEGLASLRKESLANDSAVQEALKKLAAAKEVYEPLQVKLCHNNAQWQREQKKVESKEKAARDQEGKMKAAQAREREAAAKLRAVLRDLEHARHGRHR